MAANVILVTGGAGFIGSNLVRALLARTTWRIVNVDKLTYAGNLESLSDVVDHERHRFEQIDIADSEKLNACLNRWRPAAVIHLAAESHVDRSIEQPDVFVRTNVVGTHNLLIASYRAWQEYGSRFRFLHVSTDEVYGSLEPSSAAFTEESRYDPSSPYAATKAAADHLVHAWHQTYGMPTLISNCGNNFGPFQFPEKLIPTVVLSALAGRPIPIYGQGSQIRDWIHVDDHVNALLSILSNGIPGGTYNIGCCWEKSNLEIAYEICEMLDEMRPLPNNSTGERRHADFITFVQDRPGHDTRYAIDPSKVRQELGWSPKHSFRDGLLQTVRWYLENDRWWKSLVDGEFRMQRFGNRLSTEHH